MNFSELPPSKQWAPLKHRGEKLAEVWFKPAGEPFGLTFRIPRESFDLPGLGQRLTAGSLLKAVAVAVEDVASCHQGDDGFDVELGRPLTAPDDGSDLIVQVRLKPPIESTAAQESGDQEGASEEVAADEAGEGETDAASDVVAVAGDPEPLSPERQDLEARWKSILGLEATIDMLRLSIEGVQSEMEASAAKTLTMEEKVHALNADVAQWNKAKGRVRHALPKVKDFLHRATWAIATPERKKIEEFFKNHGRSDVAFPDVDKMPEQLENLLKDRQILSAHGVTVQQECKAVVADIKGALRNLQNNALTRAKKEKERDRRKR